MQKLRRISPLSLAKVMALYYGIVALVFLVPLFLFLTIIGYPMGQSGWGLINILLYPVISTVSGFIGGLLSAWILNFVLEFFGGLEFSMTSRRKKRKRMYKPVH